MKDPCLACLLLECDEQDSNCLFVKTQTAVSARYYSKLRNDPVRYAEHLLKMRVINGKYRRSEKGHATNRVQAKKWRAANPERTREIQQKSHEKHKVKRLAAAREYKRKKRTATSGSPNERRR